jgi:hypothetical protein
MRTSQRQGLKKAGVVILLSWSGISQAAEDSAFRTLGPSLQSYEPNLIGYTWASEDTGFVDFTLSVKYPLLPKLTQRFLSANERVFLAFTGRFAFYYETRESSPVIVKRINPKLYFQHVFDDGAGSSRNSEGPDWLPQRVQEPRTYATLAYAHESNGQTIDSESVYKEALGNAPDPRFAMDSIGRGWDYLELNARHVLIDRAGYRWSVNGSLKDFLNEGLLQGHPDEVRDWEDTTKAKPRSTVDGLTARIKFESVHPNTTVITGTKLSLAYTTGLQSAGRFSTVRLEAGLQVYEMPIVIWCSQGYVNDLARYYLNIRACGVALEVAGF